MHVISPTYVIPLYMTFKIKRGPYGLFAYFDVGSLQNITFYLN